MTKEIFARAEDRETPCYCGDTMYRQLSAPAFRPPMTPYQSPVTGKWIDGEKARREDLARSHSIPYDPGMKQDLTRRTQEAEAKLDKAVDSAVEQAWNQVKT